MSPVLGWIPLVWTLRVAATLLLGAASAVAFLYLLRFFRPRHLARIVGGDLPSIRTVGASAKVMGTEVEATAVLKDDSREELKTLREGFTDLKRRVRRLESGAWGDAEHGDET